MTKTLQIRGMTCSKCVAHVKMGLEELDEVLSADVSLDDHTAIVTLRIDITDQKLTEAVEEVGYEVLSIV